LALQSEAFNVSGTWTVTTGGTGVAPVVTQATGIADPAGGTTAERIQLSVGSGTLSTDFSILRQTVTFTAVAHTFSVYLRSATSGSQFVAIRFNSAPQTILEITPFWQRFTFTGTPSAGSRDFGFDLRGNNTSASGSADFYAWGAQVEIGSIATTYIPTTVAAVSRAADVISASGALVSSLIGQTEGTIYAEVDLRNWIASGRILTCSNGTSNERIIIQVGANRTLQAIVTTASADVVDISTASGQVNGVYKCALTYASGDFAFYVNGTQIGTDSSGGVPASTSVFLGKIGTSASTNFLNDRIRAAALYTTRLSNAQLAELTRL
jgi:molybdopterin-binding protein